MTVRGKVSPLVAIANRFPGIASMMRGWDRSIALSVDGQEIVIVTSGGHAEVLNNSPRRGDVCFWLTEPTLDMLIAGRLSLLTAKLSGRLRSEGNIADILRFASIFTACLQQQRGGYSPTSNTPIVSSYRAK